MESRRAAITGGILYRGGSFLQATAAAALPPLPSPRRPTTEFLNPFAPRRAHVSTKKRGKASVGPSARLAPLSLFPLLSSLLSLLRLPSSLPTSSRFRASCPFRLPRLRGAIRGIMTFVRELSRRRFARVVSAARRNRTRARARGA